ncbi:Os01g0860700, partial [Oryza sativa Japonica Group]
LPFLFVCRRRRVFEGRSGGSQREGGRCLETERRRGALVVLKASRRLPPPMHVATPVPPSPPPPPGLCSTLASAPPAHARAHMVLCLLPVPLQCLPVPLLVLPSHQ